MIHVYSRSERLLRTLDRLLSVYTPDRELVVVETTVEPTCFELRGDRYFIVLNPTEEDLVFALAHEFAHMVAFENYFPYAGDEHRHFGEVEMAVLEELL